jgi:cell wall-associated NlpC family hydrolase
LGDDSHQLRDGAGLVGTIYKSHGILLPRDADPMFRKSQNVTDPTALLPGDLFFFAPTGRPTVHVTHVMMYIGGDKLVESSVPSFENNSTRIVTLRERFGYDLQVLRPTILRTLLLCSPPNHAHFNVAGAQVGSLRQDERRPHLLGPHAGGQDLIFCALSRQKVSRQNRAWKNAEQETLQTTRLPLHLLQSTLQQYKLQLKHQIRRRI